MFFIPLNQIESVELVVHALRAAGGEADCSVCPARRVCMKQCLTIAETVGKMLQAGTLPAIGEEAEPTVAETPAQTPEPEGGTRGRLKVIK